MKDQVIELVEAAKEVVSCWERGNLAGAIHALQIAADDIDLSQISDLAQSDAAPEKKSPDFWTRTMPVLSTCHLPGPDTLNQSIQDCQVAAIDGGWIVRIDYLNGAGEDCVVQDEWLKPIIAWLQKNMPGCCWVSFDRDGDSFEEMPTYDW